MSTNLKFSPGPFIAYAMGESNLDTGLPFTHPRRYLEASELSLCDALDYYESLVSHDVLQEMCYYNAMDGAFAYTCTCTFIGSKYLGILT